MHAHLLLLHQLGIGAVVDNVLAKDRGSERAVDLLGIDILVLAVEDEVVALGVEADRHLAAKEDEREDIAVLYASQRIAFIATRHATYLLLLGEEELVGVDAVCDGAADDREPVKDKWWLVRVLEEQLLEHVEDDGQDEEGCETGSYNDRSGRVGSEVANRLRDSREGTHTARQRTAGA